MRKMKAHAIAYQQPIPKVYNILPPPKVDVEEVIAIMFTVRRNHVKRALEWLILNHIDYADVILSTENLNEYPEDMPPVSVEYKQMLHNKTPEGTSVHDMEEEDGTAEGDCAFTVHGLTGQEFNIMTTNAVKMKALHHLNSQGKFLAIGHKEEAESIWNNPQLYPQMFPWLFPYGLGGIGTVADNKEGKCKARFPCPTFESSQVDLETGALSIKKHEAWMNFITPVLTYITRCNTDVTYYITKTGLKTHTIFESIRSVFDKHNDILSSSLSEREKARKLMNKIVNALSTKNEMGGPMVCMYLLGNPDHYTNHKFVPFYWYAFVAEAQKAWEQPNSVESADKVTLIRTKKRIVGLSPSHDYIYRPSELEFMTLYEWARCSKRQKFNNKTKNSKNKSGTKKPVKYKGYDSQYIQKVEDVEDSASSSYGDEDNEHDYSLDDNSTDNESASDEEKLSDIPKDDNSEKLPKNMYRFDKQHPLHETHVSVMIPNDANRVVNFIGKNIPRRDQGDREFYCLTMLALFKPWRSGLDLKPKHKSWDETFNEHKFTPRQEQIMSNFHIKYECLNARDDFHAQMKAGSGQNGWHLSLWDDNGNNEENEISLEQDPYVNPENISDVLDLQKAGWLDEVFDINQDIHINHINPQNDLSGSAWKSVLQAKKQDILDLRSLPSESLAKPVEAHFIPNVVKEEWEVLSYRFITVAPTGTAAALLSGSTYHSVLGINEMASEAQTAKSLIQVRTRLLGVDYIFLDEVSMLSCYDMYKISTQLCRVMNKPTEPFGGLNMLFAGDFAQLPPPVGGENISLYSHMIGKVATNEKAQQEALGRALWHQVTTVVILRKNMRQQSQSKEDDQFRTALENMRYKDCTPADIQFLRSLITSKMPGKHSIASPEFRFVSIITAKNAQKDEINQLGSERFAQETGQQLVHFYSEDTPKSHEDTKRTQKKSKATLPLAKIDDKTQHILWNLPHSSADKHMAGKLSLCHGMPIMIKCNVATELCITNGQEATVVGWKATIGKRQQQMLDVLFVQLKSPPKPVDIDGLPENVVPLTRSNIAITCKLPDGSKVSISRSQVEVLPNFAMTDFASQGKTRPYNPVDLNNCRSHQAYYTALSRSSTAAGTVILQGFDAKKITGRASGALRQEFRDLELLDEITKSRYEGNLTNSICGEHRNVLIHAFRLHKGMSHVPINVHNSIKWNKKDPMLDPIADDMPWNMVSKLKKQATIATANTNRTSHDINSTPVAKGKRKEITPQKEHKAKVHKTQSNSAKSNGGSNTDPQSLSPYGMNWHQNSCAYDAVLSILHSIWLGNKEHYTAVFRRMNNDIMNALVLDFAKHAHGIITMESARDNLRRSLHSLAPQHFHWGNFTSVPHLLEYLLSMPSVTIESKLCCENNHVANRRRPDNNTCCVVSAGATQYISTADWMHTMKEETRQTCDTCSERLFMQHKFAFPLPFIALDFSGMTMSLDDTLYLSINQSNVTYKLRGIVYFGVAHFTSRIIYENGMVWFHDSVETGRNVIYEGMLQTMHAQLNNNRGKDATMAIYAQC
ncbi:hypothetical protein AX14_014404 [Amanita brunnescens Koide BX004]|nr:hypothetical protein AX14_014404 [Amanita brunnescens Koide BX004]